MFDFVDIVGQSSFLRRLFEVYLGPNPLQVWFRPRGLQMLRTLPATAQQKLAEAMAGTQLVSFRGLPGTHQISESFVGGVRNPHGGQVTRTVAACQLQGVDRK